MGNEKLQLVKTAVTNLQKKFGKEAVNYLGNTDIEPIPRISSQCIAIDEVTGGGYPLGRIVELYGGESSGKTTACYHAIAQAQKQFPEKFCGFVDSEFSFDPVYAGNCGVDVANLVVAQPESGTDGFAILQGMIEEGASLVVVDSVAAMVPREEVEEEDYGKGMIGVQARMMSRALRKLTSIIGKYKCVVIFTNQTREKVGLVYGNPETTSGGNALKFYASIRLKLSKIGTIEEGSGDDKQKTSVRTRVEAVKNKTAPPFRRAEYIVTFGKGIDNEAAVFNAIIDRGLIEKRNAGWYIVEGNKLQGVQKLREFFTANPDIYEKYRRMVLENRKPEVIPEEEREPEENQKVDEVGEI